MRYIHHLIDDKNFKFVSDLDDIGHYEIVNLNLANEDNGESKLKNRVLMREDGQAGAVLLILIIILVVFLIVHYWGWGPIEHFFSYIAKHLPNPPVN